MINNVNIQNNLLSYIESIISSNTIFNLELEKRNNYKSDNTNYDYKEISYVEVGNFSLFSNKNNLRVFSLNKLLKSTLQIQKYAGCILLNTTGCYISVLKKSFFYKELSKYILKNIIFAFHKFIFFINFNLKQYVFMYTKYTRYVYEVYEKGECFVWGGHTNVL